MYLLRILYIICTMMALSSAAVIPQHNQVSKNPSTVAPDFSNNGISAPLLIYTSSTPRPEVEETHTVSKTDRTILFSGQNAIMSQIDQISTSKASASTNEHIDELGQTYASKQADDLAVTQVNKVRSYAQGQDLNGVKDLYLKDETNAVFAEDHSKGDREMIGISKSNVEEQISDPSGFDQTFLTVENHELHAVEDQGSLEVTGNSKAERTYLAGTSDDDTSFYAIDDDEKLHIVRNGQGVEHDTKQSSVTGIGFTDDFIESFALDETQKTIEVDNEGLRASIGVDKTNGSYNSIDLDGNGEVIGIDETAHQINVKDGDIGISLNTNDINNLYGFKDQAGSVGGYEGNGTDHSVTITDGALSANFDMNNIDELFGISTPDGIDDVHMINEAGKSVMIDDGEQGVAIGANEINELHGVFDKGEVQERYQGNQVDKIIAVAEGSSGGSLQTSAINGIYQVNDDDGKMQTVATGGQMFGHTVVIGDDHDDGNYEAGAVDKLLWMTDMEAPSDYGYGLNTPKPEYQTPETDVLIIQEGVVGIAQDGYPYRVSGANREPEASGMDGVKDLVEKLEHLYEVHDFGRIGNIFGGGKKNKINVKITIDMEI